MPHAPYTSLLERTFDPQQSAFPACEGTTISTVSDLHYGVHQRLLVGGVTRSFTTFPNYKEREITSMLCDAITKTDHVVLNGDIFEGVYTKHVNRTKLIHYFKTLVDKWIAAAQRSEKGCKIHFIQGNHDDALDLDTMLRQKAMEHPEHFFVHPVAVRIGAILFTHGDLPLRSSAYDEITSEARHLNWERPMGTRIYKELDPSVRTWAELVSKTGNALIHNPMQNALNTIKPLQTTINALYAGLKGSILLAQMPCADGTLLPEVTDVVTGHTHNPFSAMKSIDKNGEVLSDIRFHNTGTALVNDLFNPLLITVGKDQLVTVSPFALTQQASHHRYERAKVGGYSRST